MCPDHLIHLLKFNWMAIERDRMRIMGELVVAGGH